MWKKVKMSKRPNMPLKHSVYGQIIATKDYTIRFYVEPTDRLEKMEEGGGDANVIIAEGDVSETFYNEDTEFGANARTEASVNANIETNDSINAEAEANIEAITNANADTKTGNSTASLNEYKIDFIREGVEEGGEIGGLLLGLPGTILGGIIGGIIGCGKDLYYYGLD